MACAGEFAYLATTGNYTKICLEHSDFQKSPGSGRPIREFLQGVFWKFYGLFRILLKKHKCQHIFWFWSTLKITPAQLDAIHFIDAQISCLVRIQ